MESPLVTLKHASKSFVDGKETHRVLEGVDFTLNTGASVAPVSYTHQTLPTIYSV